MILLLAVMVKPVEPVPSIHIEKQKIKEFMPLKEIEKLSIRLYQILLSDQQGDVCNFEPTCSHFALMAIERYGAFWGILMAADRLERCHPYSFSYVPAYYRAGFVPGRGMKILEKPEDVWRFR